MNNFKHSFKITNSHIDENLHVNNVFYIQWMQDVAIAHSQNVGDTKEFQLSHNATWFAKNHYIEYNKPLYEGDILSVETSIGDFRKIACYREYRFLRGEELIATAKTLWVFMDVSTQKPKAIPIELINLYKKNKSL